MIKFCDDTEAYVGSEAIRKLSNEQPKKRLLYFTVKWYVKPKPVRNWPSNKIKTNLRQKFVI